MTIHAKFVDDKDGNLIDVKYYCSEFCFNGAGNVGVGAYPCGSETDYDVFCDHCANKLWEGLENPELHADLKIVNGINVSDTGADTGARQFTGWLPYCGLDHNTREVK